MTQTFAFVRISNVDDYLKCGWIPHESLRETSHGEYSVLMEFISCDCGKELPVPNQRAVSE